MSTPAIGVVIRPQHAPEDIPGLVALAERAGVDEVWVWEDAFLEGGLTVSAVALARTERIRIGLGLMPAPLRNVALAAMEVATLDRQFPGRFLPGFGHGILDWMAQAGARVESPVTLLGEYLRAMRGLLAGDELTVSGRYVTLDRVRLGWPPASVPPLLVGARGPRTLALAGAAGDGVILDAGPSPDGVAASLAQAGGGDGFHAVVFVPSATGPDARERIDAEARGWGNDLPPSPAVGTPDEVADLARRYAAAGATSVVLQPVGDVADVPEVIALAGAVRAALA